MRRYVSAYDFASNALCFAYGNSLIHSMLDALNALRKGHSDPIEYLLTSPWFPVPTYTEWVTDKMDRGGTVREQAMERFDFPAVKLMDSLAVAVNEAIQNRDIAETVRLLNQMSHLIYDYSTV